MFLHDVITMGAHKTPDRAAVRWIGGERSYCDFESDVRRLAAATRRTVERGGRVAILAENLPEFVTAYYGVPAGGGVLTFLNYRLHPREWVWIMNNAGVAALLIQDKFLDALSPLLDEIDTLHTTVVIEDGSDLSHDFPTYDDFVAGPGDDFPDDLDDRDIAWLLYTSGTTGFPKGAMLSHRNVMAAVLSLLVESEPMDDDQSLVAFPLCHVAGYTVPATHLRRGTSILSRAFEPRSWMELVDEFGVTGTAMAPTMIDMVLRHPDIDDFRLDTLESIGYGASAMPVELLRRAIDRFGPIVRSGFGMTELSGNVLVFRAEHHERAVNGEEHLLSSCGVPMSMADVKVVDDDFVECPPGVVGEIVARAEQVLTGYFDNPSATADSFVEGWFRTGDLARRDEEGFFYVVDRKKDMILSGGENVYSREVEEMLHQHPDVDDVAVVGLPDATWGEIVCAVVVRRRGSSLTADDVVAYAREHLGGYKRPRRVAFVDELPRNATGKTLKRELRERFSADVQE